MPERIRVYCADDNRLVADALELKLHGEKNFEWVGWTPDANDLVQKVREAAADVVLLDIDMPPNDSFSALAQLTHEAPEVRTVILSGHLKREYYDRAIEAGAMGYMSKLADIRVILDSIRRVVGGEFVTDVGPELESG